MLSGGQALTAQYQVRVGNQTRIIAGNAAIGGLTAALHAAMIGKPMGHAFVIGALGGGIHGSGKLLGRDMDLPSIAVGATGTSIVANAGRGASAFDELVFPVTAVRLRVTPNAVHKVHIALNAYESAALARRLVRPELRVDWDRSLQSGTFVFRTSSPLSAPGGRRANGRTAASIITLSNFSRRPDETFQHERVHVQQGWFFQEVWGRPIEDGLRASWLRRIPSWLEIGLLPPTLLALERSMAGMNGPFRSWHEWEAETISRGRDHSLRVSRP
jgi:hypothetical protein